MAFAAGRIDPGILGRHRRLREYTPRDYEIVQAELGKREGLLILPNVATQASDLLSQADDLTGQTLRYSLQNLIERHTERYVPSITATLRSEYLMLGLADAAILHALAPGVTLLTADFRLHGKAVASGGVSININHLRDVFMA